MPLEEIRGALARGYCSKENEHKVLDPDLIEAMAIEIDKLFLTLPLLTTDKQQEK